MAKAAVFGGLAAILVVAAVVAIVATVSTSHKSNGSTLATSTKSVSAICANTLYPETCQRSMSTVANATSDPKDVVKASIQLALNELNESFQKSLEVGKGAANSSITAGAIANCKELLQDASDDLQAIVKLGNEALRRQDDLEHWITATMTFMDNCADGFEDSELRTAMQNVLRNATEMSSNALAIITNIGKFLQQADKLFNVTNVSNFQHRRLLENSNDLDAQGFPVWLSAGDRKLLAAGGAPRAKPNAVVAKDGSGNFKSIQAAIDAVPKDKKGRYVIYVKAGIYEETVLIPKDKTNIFMYGDGPKRTRVLGHKSNADGITTQDTATFCKLLSLSLSSVCISLPICPCRYT